MGVLIDASVLIDQERGHTDLAAYMRGRESDEFFLSVVTMSELLHGVHRARDARVRAQRSAFVDTVLDEFPVLSVDSGIARTHAQLWADLVKAGRMIGLHDLWLAATAIYHGFSLATLNLREFQRVPGLVVESWP